MKLKFPASKKKYKCSENMTQSIETFASTYSKEKMRWAHKFLKICFLPNQLKKANETQNEISFHTQSTDENDCPKATGAFTH